MTETPEQHQDPSINLLALAAGMSYEKASEYIATALGTAALSSEAIQKLEFSNYRMPSNGLTWPELKAYLTHGYITVEVLQKMGARLLKGDHLDKFIGALESQAASTSIARIAGRYDFPFWVVSEGLAEMLSHTDAFDTSCLNSEAKLPFPACYFVLPRGVAELPDGEFIELLGCGHFTIDDLKTVGLELPDDAEGERFYVMAMTNLGNCYYSRLPVVDGKVDDPSTHEFKMHSRNSLEVVDDEEGVGKASADLTVGWALRLLTAMNAEPELVEDEMFLKKRKAKKGRRELTFKQPRWLGEKVKYVGKGDRGNGSSPATHWRRGHFARRRCGEGRKDCRVVYIKPTLINAKEEDDA